MFKNTSGQKFRFYAFDATTGLPKTGDAAQLTAYNSLDFGAVTAITDTSAAEEDSTNAKGYYLFDATQGETNADNINPTCKSSTANIVLHYVGPRWTLPPNFTKTSIDTNGRLDVIKVAGTTQTARDLGASVLVSVGTGAGQVNVSGGKVPATIAAGDLATDSVNAAALAADAVTEIQAGLSTLTQANVRTAVGMASANLDTQLSGINAKTTNLPAAPAAVSDIPTANQNADALLKRDWTAVTGEAARSVLNALRKLRNKWSTTAAAGKLRVFKEDDLTAAYDQTLTSDAAAAPITDLNGS